MTKSIYGFTKKHFLEISIFLCFILPPMGIFLLLIAGCHQLQRSWKEGERIDVSPVQFLLSCMFIASIGSAIAMKDYSHFLVSALLLSYFGVFEKVKKEGVQKLFSSFKWITICGGIYFYSLYPFQQFLMDHTLLSYFTGTALLGQMNMDHYERLIGAGYNPNLSVTIVLIGLAFLLAECLKNFRSASYFKLAIQLTVVCMFIHAILLTGSKAGFASMLVIFSLFIFRLNKLSGILLVLMMGLNIKLLLSWMPRSSYLVESASKRTEIWKRSIHLWQEHSLFGTTSLGFHKEYFYHFHEKMPHAHNMVLGIFTEYGSLGGIAFLIVVIINVYKVFTLYLSKQNNKVHLDVFLLSLPVILLTGVFDYVLYSPQVALMAIILLASWDKYTARIPLLDPRNVSYARKWLLSFSVKTSKSKKHS